MLVDLAHGDLATARHCYLTTISHRTGGQQTVELWFAVYHDTLYLLSRSGERADWVRNLRRTPEVEIRIGHTVRSGTARVVTDTVEDGRARRLITCKYQPRASVRVPELLPIAVDLS